MARRVAVVLVTATLVASCDKAEAPPPPHPDARVEEQLATLRDKNRVLLVFAPSEQDPRYVAQQKLAAEASGGFEERDLVTVPVLGDAPALDSRYAIARGAFAVLLIGKDGHTAYRATEPAPPADLFAKIDAMPMRQAEMRERAVTPAR